MRILILFGVMLMMASCSSNLRPFTQNMYDDFSWTSEEIQRIQFYLSSDIRLWRDRGNEQSRIKDGKIRVIDGREVEEVIIKKGTPGIVLFSPKENRFAVSFDSDKDKYLMFGPNEKRDGRYVLLAKDWKRKRGKITYGGEIFNTDANSAYASLMVDIKAARESKYKRETPGGRRVSR